MSTGQKDTKPPFGFFDIFKTPTMSSNTVSSETYTLPLLSSTEQSRAQTSTIKMTETILSSTLTTSMPIISSTSQTQKNVTVGLKIFTVVSINVAVELKNVSGSYKWLNVTSATPQSTKLISTGNSTSAPMNLTRVPALNITTELSTKTAPRILTTSQQSKIFTETTKLAIATATRNTQTVPASQNVTLLIKKDETSQTPSDGGATKTATTADNDGPDLNVTIAVSENPPRVQPRSSTTDDAPNVQNEVTTVAAIMEQTAIPEARS